MITLNFSSSFSLGIYIFSFIFVCFNNFPGLRVSDWGTVAPILSNLNFKLSFHGIRTQIPILIPIPIPVPWTNSHCIWYGIPHNYPEAKAKFSRLSLCFLVVYVCRSQLGRKTCTDINIFLYSTNKLYVGKNLSKKLKTIPPQNMSRLKKIYFIWIWLHHEDCLVKSWFLLSENPEKSLLYSFVLSEFSSWKTLI